MEPRHFIYQVIDPRAKDAKIKPTPKLAMLTVFSDDEMDRVPEGAVEVNGEPVEGDPEGTYFDAWEMDSEGKVTVNLEKAKDIRMSYLRQRRAALFESLDQRQFQFYCSKDEEKIEEIEKVKQELRDFPEKINWKVISTLQDINHILPPRLI